MNSFDPDGIFTIQTAPAPKMRASTLKAIELMENHGLHARDALKLATGKTTIHPASVSEFKRKAAQHSLTRPAMVKMAHDVVKNVLQGQTDSYTTQKMTRTGDVVTVTETIAPTHTNKLAAAAMVMDRDQPLIHRNVNLTGDLKDFMPVDLDTFS